jgi:phosphoribosylglycinamide formyltransferase 1
MKQPINIAILASGAGSNANAVAHYFKENQAINIKLIVCNVKDVGVFKVADAHQIKSVLLPNHEIDSKLLSLLRIHQIDFVVLAGFLRKIPADVTAAYANKMVNIHPALLPAYGGKGMYGARVHQAVIESQEKESGITIHLVNDHYDEGGILFQASCAIEPNETPESLAGKIHVLEHRHFAPIIEQHILKTF